MTRGILVLNAGSSSIKFALYPAAPASDEDAAAYHGEIEGIGHALHLLVRDARRKSLADRADRKSTRLNSSHSQISYAVFCLKKKKKRENKTQLHYKHT